MSYVPQNLPAKPKPDDYVDHAIALLLAHVELRTARRDYIPPSLRDDIERCFRAYALATRP